MKPKAILAVLAWSLCLAAASDPSDRLADPAQEARARAIFREVRCMVCQNESIDDSQADLARDLRQVVREQVHAGRTDAQVKRFLSDRYGDFVLMRPRFSLGNLALWIGPFLVLGLGFALLLARLRNRAPEVELSAEEAERLGRLSAGDPL
jgi:cytochrome c-type biogenesis protein CcmH